MINQVKAAPSVCPVTVEIVRQNARDIFEELIEFCETCDSPVWFFEKSLLGQVAVLGCCFIRLFLTARHERLRLEGYLNDGKYRRGNHYAERTLKTYYGEVTYGRKYLMSRWGGSGYCPLDKVLGLTRDRLSPWMMQWVARLATRMSFQASQMVCKAVLNWAPATETIEQVVLGMG